MAICHCVTDFEMKEVQKGCWELTKYNGTPYAHIEIPSNIEGKTIVSLGEELFSATKYLKSVKISEGIKKIENKAFYLSQVSDVELPQSLEYIGDESFYCTQIEKIFIPRNVKHIGERAFHVLVEAKIEDGCTAPLTSEGALRPLEIFHIPKSITEISKNIFWTVVAAPSKKEAVKDESGHTVRNACGEVVTHWVGSPGRSTTDIPPNLTIHCDENSAAYNFAKQNNVKIANYGDDSLYKDIFYVDYFRGATSITIPANIRIIRKARYASWSNLTSIVFEEGSNLEIIEQGAFQDAPILKSIIFPKFLKKIEKNAFYNCRELSHISFDACDVLEFIGERAFSQCGVSAGASIGNISLSPVINHLGEFAFSQSSIKSVDLYRSVLLTEIPKGAFCSCRNLNKVFLPKSGSIKVIGESAFAGTNISKFNFAGIEYIGKGAFCNCYKLKKAIISTDCEEDNAFETTLSDTPITVIRKDISNFDGESQNSNNYFNKIVDKIQQLFKKIKTLFK